MSAKQRRHERNVIARLASIESKLDALLKFAGIDPATLADLEALEGLQDDQEGQDDEGLDVADDAMDEVRAALADLQNGSGIDPALVVPAPVTSPAPTPTPVPALVADATPAAAPAPAVKPPDKAKPTGTAKK